MPVPLPSRHCRQQPHQPLAAERHTPASDLLLLLGLAMARLLAVVAETLAAMLPSLGSQTSTLVLLQHRAASFFSGIDPAIHCRIWPLLQTFQDSPAATVRCATSANSGQEKVLPRVEHLAECNVTVGSDLQSHLCGGTQVMASRSPVCASAKLGFAGFRQAESTKTCSLAV